MKRTVGIIGLIGVGVCYFVLIMSICTGTCFDSNGFSPQVPFFTIVLIICAIIAIVCLIEDVLKFIGKCLGLRQKEEHYVTLCKHCGAKVELHQNYCTNCGNKVC